MDKILTVIGRVEKVHFAEQGIRDVYARIDTGAKTSAIWASNITERGSILEFTLFDTASEHHTGQIIRVHSFERRIVASSNGTSEERYVVKLSIRLHGRAIRARFTLADRSTQTYPVLIGRNILLGKFVVDVKKGTPLVAHEKRRSSALQAGLKRKRII